MNRVIVLNISMLSLIIGVIFGIIAPVPHAGVVSLFGLSLLAAPLVMLYLIMDGKLDLTTPKDSILTGALIGFCSNITYAAAYCIITAVMDLGFHYTNNLFLSAMITKSPLWLLGVFIVFIGILFATSNAFTGFATYYIINFIRDMYEKKHPEITEQEDFTPENNK